MKKLYLVLAMLSLFGINPIYCQDYANQIKKYWANFVKNVSYYYDILMAPKQAPTPVTRLEEEEESTKSKFWQQIKDQIDQKLKVLYGKEIYKPISFIIHVETWKKPLNKTEVIRYPDGKVIQYKITPHPTNPGEYTVEGRRWA